MINDFTFISENKPVFFVIKPFDNVKYWMKKKLRSCDQ